MKPTLHILRLKDDARYEWPKDANKLCNEIAGKDELVLAWGNLLCLSFEHDGLYITTTNGVKIPLPESEYTVTLETPVVSDERIEAVARELMQMLQVPRSGRMQIHVADRLRAFACSILSQSGLMSKERVREVLRERIESASGIDETILDEYKRGYLACNDDFAAALNISLDKKNDSLETKLTEAE